MRILRSQVSMAIGAEALMGVGELGVRAVAGVRDGQECRAVNSQRFHCGLQPFAFTREETPQPKQGNPGASSISRRSSQNPIILAIANSSPNENGTRPPGPGWSM